MLKCFFVVLSLLLGSSFGSVLVNSNNQENLSRHAYWFSDLHLDDHYYPGAPTKCLGGTSTGMKCCRIYDLPAKGAHKASQWGDYACDTPRLLIHTLMNATREMLFPSHPPSAILQTGDLVDHHDLFQDFSHNMHEVDICTTALESLGDYPKIMVIGNHDTWPVDTLGLPSTKDNSTALTHYLLSRWSSFAPFSTFAVDQRQEFLEGGFYTYDLTPSLRLLVTNSLYDDNHNLLIAKVKDPAGQTTWLEAALAQARAQGENVWLFGHIPPGNGEADPAYTSLLIKLSGAYKDVIKGQFFGHTHLDSFVLYPSGSYAMIMPSVVPDNHGPTVRRLTYKEDGTLEDWVTYGLSLDGLIVNSTVVLQELWRASTVLGPSLDVEGWYQRALTNRTVLKDWWWWHHAGNPPPASLERMGAALKAIKL